MCDNSHLIGSCQVSTQHSDVMFNYKAPTQGQGVNTQPQKLFIYSRTL